MNNEDAGIACLAGVVVGLLSGIPLGAFLYEALGEFSLFIDLWWLG
jgi:hypothetical protein